ncbi:MAG: hypothetical protein J0L84_01430, partial [Verrucomicrobia bacterium]|nr:hypothetical protein [Verrucomicrobiota bacterium]
RALLLWAAAALGLVMGGVSRLPRQNLLVAALLAGGCGLSLALLSGRPVALITLQSVVLVLGARLTARWMLRRRASMPGYGAGVAVLTGMLSAGLLLIGASDGAIASGWGWGITLASGYLLVTPWLLDKRERASVAEAGPAWLLAALAVGCLWIAG